MDNGAYSFGAGLLRPVYDETFSSWLTRCALHRRISSITEADIEDRYSYITHQGIFKTSSLGLEFDFNDDITKSLLSNLNIDLGLAKSHFQAKTSLLLHPAFRFAYCHQCARTDVQAKRFISWRKSWCYVGYVYCDTHKCLLSYIKNGDEVLKQWHAFAEGELGEYTQGRVASYHRRNHGIPPSRARGWLTLKVQKWINRLYTSPLCLASQTRGNLNASDILKAVHLTLSLLLTPRTESRVPGAALSIFTAAIPVIVHKDLDLQERLDHGAAHSVPYERMCALLLLGIALNIFNSHELALLSNIVSDAEFSMPDSIGVAALAAEHVHISEYEEFESMVHSSPLGAVFGLDFVTAMLRLPKR